MDRSSAGPAKDGGCASLTDYAGTDSQFATDLTIAEPGLYTVTVTAHDKANGNAGVDHSTFIVSKGGD